VVESNARQERPAEMPRTGRGAQFRLSARILSLQGVFPFEQAFVGRGKRGSMGDGRGDQSRLRLPSDSSSVANQIAACVSSSSTT
jgi:hypothetical protein